MKERKSRFWLGLDMDCVVGVRNRQDQGVGSEPITASAVELRSSTRRLSHTARHPYRTRKELNMLATFAMRLCGAVMQTFKLFCHMPARKTNPTTREAFCSNDCSQIPASHHSVLRVLGHSKSSGEVSLLRKYWPTALGWPLEHGTGIRDLHISKAYIFSQSRAYISRTFLAKQ